MAADWCRPRAGLGPLLETLRAGPCRIAYLGASITAQRDGYRSRLHAWLADHSGQPHREVNAGIGGVDALAGVFLMDELVLRHRPQLCFIEFASGDAGRALGKELVGRAVEGMVRKLRRQGCRIVFLHMFRDDAAERGMAGIIAAYEEIARHYGIPSLHLDQLIRARLAQGQQAQSALLRDGIHTTPAGSRLLVEAIAGVWDSLASPPAEDLPLPPRAADCFESTELVPALPVMLADPATAVVRRFRLLWPYLELDHHARLRYETLGNVAGILVISGPESGMFELESQGTRRRYSDRDRWCARQRLNAVSFAAEFPQLSSLQLRLCGEGEGGRPDQRLLLHSFMVQR